MVINVLLKADLDLFFEHYLSKDGLKILLAQTYTMFMAYTVIVRNNYHINRQSSKISVVYGYRCSDRPLYRCSDRPLGIMNFFWGHFWSWIFKWLSGRNSRNWIRKRSKVAFSYNYWIIWYLNYLIYDWWKTKWEAEWLTD